MRVSEERELERTLVRRWADCQVKQRPSEQSHAIALDSRAVLGEDGQTHSALRW